MYLEWKSSPFRHISGFFQTLGPATYAFKLCHRLICGMIILLFHNTVNNPTNLFKGISKAFVGQSKQKYARARRNAPEMAKWCFGILWDGGEQGCLQSIKIHQQKWWNLSDSPLKPFGFTIGWWDVSIVQFTLYSWQCWFVFFHPETRKLHPRKLTWKLKITHLKRKNIWT